MNAAIKCRRLPGSAATIAISAMVAVGPVFAMIPGRAPVATDINIGIASLYRSCAKGADFSVIQPVAPTPMLTSQDVAKWIPQDMAATNDQGAVASQIVDRSVAAVLESEQFRSSSLGATAQSLERAMQQDVSFGGSEPASTKHELKFQMRAANARALVDYAGYFNAQLSYQAIGNTAGVELYERVAKETKLVYGTTVQPGETRNVVSLRYDF